jgi:hypothetical protein
MSEGPHWNSTFIPLHSQCDSGLTKCRKLGCKFTNGWSAMKIDL